MWNILWKYPSGTSRVIGTFISFLCTNQLKYKFLAAWQFCNPTHLVHLVNSHILVFPYKTAETLWFNNEVLTYSLRDFSKRGYWWVSEICHVLLDSDKAPEPDGFGAHFFKSAWNAVGEQVCAWPSRASLLLVSFLEEANATITLIPKVKNPTLISEFHPISCCNTLYKCISKILANTLKMCLNGFISRSQTTFVPSRKISDDVLLAQESQWMISCLSFQIVFEIFKAYNSVELEFFWRLLCVLKSFLDQYLYFYSQVLHILEWRLGWVLWMLEGA